MPKYYSTKLPIATKEDGNFVVISDALEDIKQSIKMIILTNPGEKIMDPSFGVGILNYLFENKDSITFDNSEFLNPLQIEDLEKKLESVVRFQLTKYLPNIQVNSIDIVFEDNVLFLSIKYTYFGNIEQAYEQTIPF